MKKHIFLHAFILLFVVPHSALAMEISQGFRTVEQFRDKYNQIKGFTIMTTPEATTALLRKGVEAGTYILKPTRDDKTKLFVPVIVYNNGVGQIEVKKLDPEFTVEQVENEILRLKHTKILTHPLLVTIRTQDNQDFQVEEPLAKLSLTLKHLIEDAGTEIVFPLPNITAKTWRILQEQLARVYDIAQKGAEAKEAEIEIRRSLKSLDTASLIELITALNYLDIPDFLRLSMDVAKATEVKNITPAQIATLPREIRNPIVIGQMERILGPFTGQLLTIEKERAQVVQLCVTPDTRKIVAGYNNFNMAFGSGNTICVWDIRDGGKLLELKVPQIIHSVCVTPDGKIIASVGSTIMIWDINDGRQLQKFSYKTAEWIPAVCVTADGGKIVAAFGDNTIRVLNMKGEQLAQCKGHTAPVNAISLTADDSNIVSTSHDGTIRVWDITSGKQVPDFQYNAVQGLIPVCVTAAHNKIVVGFSTGIIRVLDMQGTQLTQCIGHTERVQSVSMTLDGNKIVSGSRDRTVRVWNSNDGSTVRVFRFYSEVISVCVTPDDSRIVAGFSDGSICALEIVSLLDRLPTITSEQTQKIWQYLQGDHKGGWTGILDILK